MQEKINITEKRQKTTVKDLLSPLRGAYLLSDTQAGQPKIEGHMKEGELFTTSNDKDIYDTFPVLHPIFSGFKIQLYG